MTISMVTLGPTPPDVWAEIVTLTLEYSVSPIIINSEYYIIYSYMILYLLYIIPVTFVCVVIPENL